MQKIMISSISLLLVVGLVGCGNSDNDKNRTSDIKDNLNTKEKKGTLIYLVSIKKENDVQNVDDFNCYVDKIDFVDIQVSDEKLSPQTTLEKLFTYKVEEDSELYNVFETLENLKIEKLVVANDFAILTLANDLIVKDACIEQQIRDQITKTLLQFDNIEGVDIFVGDEELSSYLEKITTI